MLTYINKNIPLWSDKYLNIECNLRHSAATGPRRLKLSLGYPVPVLVGPLVLNDGTVLGKRHYQIQYRHLPLINWQKQLKPPFTVIQ